MKKQFLKQQFCFLLFAAQSLLCTVSAQDQGTVTFTGQVTRHEAVELDVAVQGAVYIHYGSHEDRFVSNDIEIVTAFTEEVSFTIPAGQRSVSYEKTVNWSLAGSVPDNSDSFPSASDIHDYLRVSVRCIQNCEQANARETVAFSKENGITGSTKKRRSDLDIELYGTSDGTGGYDRAGGYIVNLKLLPKYATISGTLVLPDGETAPEGLNIQLFGLDYATVGGSASTWWVQPTQQLVAFESGASEMNFRFVMDLARLTQNRFGAFIFGYNCISDACDTLGLVKSGIFDSDADRLLSNNNFFDVFLDNFLLTDNNDDVFNLQFPQPITMLGSNKQAIKIIKNKKEEPFENQVTGRVIVEKYEHSISCETYPPFQILPIDFSSDERCIFPSGTLLPSIITVSEIPFIINAGQSQATLSTDVHEMDQLLSRFEHRNEHQRIKVVCDTGCESARLKNSGYYREQSNFRMTNSAVGAHQFQFTEDFSTEPLVISLENLILPNFDLLLEEEEELDQQSH